MESGSSLRATPERLLTEVMHEGAVAALIKDPVGILLIPLALSAPSIGMQSLVRAMFGASPDPEAVNLHYWVFLVAMMGINALCGLLASFWIIVRTESCLVGRGERFETSVSRTIPRFLPYVGVFFLFWIGAGIASAMCLVPLLFFVYFCAFAPPAAALENVDLSKAFSRSGKMVRGLTGRWVTAAGTLIVLFLAITLGATGLLHASDPLLPDSAGTVLWAAGAAFNELLSFPALAIWTAVYLDLRSLQAAVLTEAEKERLPES